MARIAVFGLGYVGITTAIGFAEMGHSVVGLDILPDKVTLLGKAEVPIYEEGVQESLSKSLTKNLISFTVNTDEALRNADFVFLCVPTPMRDDGSADLTFLEKALSQMSDFLESHTVVVLKSTLPIGTGNSIKSRFLQLSNPVAYNPEFLREGTALEDFRNPDRIVIGCDMPSVAEEVSNLYRGIRSPMLITGFGEAELIKYASNAFLAVKISFINEISNLALKTNINISDVSKGMGFDKRIGDRFLNPGPGWGGSCFPKDSMELVTSASRHGVKLKVLDAAIHANEDVKIRIVELVKNAVGEELKGKRIAAWGLSFKAHTDDIRDSPALEIIRRLQSEGADVVAFDPVVKNTSIKNLVMAGSAADSTDDADLLIVLTEWPQFATEDAEDISHRMRNANVIDTRKILPNVTWKKYTTSFLALGGLA
jgi:UDPglucose 6-dehydrogenase